MKSRLLSAVVMALGLSLIACPGGEPKTKRRAKTVRSPKKPRPAKKRPEKPGPKKHPTHTHGHSHPHEDSDHHHHPHPHPHLKGPDGHHHPY